MPFNLGRRLNDLEVRGCLCNTTFLVNMSIFSNEHSLAS
jgi:hypothetical protein